MNDEKRERIEQRCKRITMAAESVASACWVLSKEQVQLELESLRMEFARLEDIIEQWDHDKFDWDPQGEGL